MLQDGLAVTKLASFDEEDERQKRQKGFLHIFKI